MEDRKLHIHIKLRNNADAQLALDCVRFIAQQASDWSAGLTKLHSVFLFTTPDLPESVPFEIDADVPGLPNTGKGLSLLGQTWMEDQIELARLKADIRAEKARRAAQTRWGTEGDQ